MSDWAKTYSGLMVNTQHRYYADESLNTNSSQLHYLSSVHALADAARIVQTVNDMYAPKLISQKIRWFTVSGSYGGNLASWFKLRYPNLILGAHDISGPNLAIADYTGFFAAQGANLPAACLNTTRYAVAQLDSLLDDPTKGWSQVQADFNVTFQTKSDIELFLFDITWGIISGQGICRARAPKATPYLTLASLFASAGPRTYKYTARGVYSLCGITWYRQTCAEFGYWQTGTDFATNPTQIAPRHLTADVFLQACNDGFGFTPSQTMESLAWTNVAYGGKDIRTENTFFTHGTSDGWSAAGITSGFVPGAGNTVITIVNGTHCSDLYWPRNTDSASLTAVRAMQKQAIATWLSAA